MNQSVNYFSGTVEAKGGLCMLKKVEIILSILTS